LKGALEAMPMDRAMLAAFVDAGLVVRARLLREPEGPEKLPQAYLLARALSRC
jgi:hypothetical protein